jgi:hypothetical protein
MDSKILKDLHETAKSMYECGTMSKQVYMNFKRLYEAKEQERTSGNKVSKKSK